jgi:S1-C subfamily serine protease
MRYRFVSVAIVLLLGAVLWGQPAPEPHAARSYLGVNLKDITPEDAASLKLRDKEGALVADVDRDAPAGKAGLKQRDVIVSFNGQKIRNPQELRRLIHETPPGRTVALAISRDGHALNVNVQLSSRPQVAQSLANPAIKPTPPAPQQDLDVPQFSMLQFWSRNGLLVEDLTPQLGEYFGVRKGQGVLVRSVEKGSTAEAAGLRAGDVIVKVNADRVSCSSEWRHAMRQLRGSVNLGIVRDKRDLTVAMKLIDRSSK